MKAGKCRSGGRWCMSERVGGPEPASSTEARRVNATPSAESSGPPVFPLWLVLGFQSAEDATKILLGAVRREA